MRRIFLDPPRDVVTHTVNAFLEENKTADTPFLPFAKGSGRISEGHGLFTLRALQNELRQVTDADTFDIYHDADRPRLSSISFISPTVSENHAFHSEKPI